MEIENSHSHSVQDHHNSAENLDAIQQLHNSKSAIRKNIIYNSRLALNKSTQKCDKYALSMSKNTNSLSK